MRHPHGSKVLTLGSTGLLGQAVVAETVRRGHIAIGAARHRAAVALDITDDSALLDALAVHTPDIVVNCAALTDIDACECDPDLAWRVNARPLALLAEWVKAADRTLVHVSTDHYFIEGGAIAHDENAAVSLVNEYARSKFAGEALALLAPHALVLRTNIVGIRGWQRPSFGEWALDVALNDRPANLFNDVYVSSIDVCAFARALFDLVKAGTYGLLNLAAGEIFSKEAFVCAIAGELGRPLTAARSGSFAALPVRRANCLGLDVRRAETVLGYPLPTLKTVAASLVRQNRDKVIG